MQRSPVRVTDRHAFDPLIDARSPAEFALDHIPGTINCPVLDDDERARDSTLHVTTPPLTARKVGGALGASTIARHTEASFGAKPDTGRTVIDGWRGGQRSLAMSQVMRQI